MCDESRAVKVDNGIRDRDYRGRGLRGNSLHGGHRRLDRQCAHQHHCACTQHQRLDGDAGAVTVEAAFGVAALVAVLVMCAAGIQAVSMQVHCVDASREAARLAARGDDADARTVARRLAPPGATVEVRHDGGYVVARVTATSRLLPAIAIAAESISAMEPEG